MAKGNWRNWQSGVCVECDSYDYLKNAPKKKGVPVCRECSNPLSIINENTGEVEAGAIRPNRVKDCLDAARSALLLTEVLEAYPITKDHANTVQEILEEKPLVLVKPQEKAGEYQTKSNKGEKQIVVSRKETPWSYEGIDIV